MRPCTGHRWGKSEKQMKYIFKKRNPCILRIKRREVTFVFHASMIV